MFKVHAKIEFTSPLMSYPASLGQLVKRKKCLAHVELPFLFLPIQLQSKDMVHKHEKLAEL